LGIATVLVLYLLSRQLFTRRVALLAAAFQAVSFWPLVETRMALETSLLPALAVLALLFLAQGLREPSRSDAPTAPAGTRRRRPWLPALAFLLSGLFTGGQVYAYTPGRVMVLLPPLLLLYLLLLDRCTLRRRWCGLLWFCLVTALTVAPLVIFLRAHPGAEQRLEQLAGPLEQLRQGEPGEVLRLVAGTASMFTLRGEPQWLYNVARRPVFDALTSLFFYVGLAICLARLRDWRHGLLLLWLLVGLAPALISPPAASFTHTLIAQPAVYLILGLGVAAAGEWVGRWRIAAGRALPALLLTINAFLAWQAYFLHWADAPEVRELYQGGITAVAHDLDTGDPPGSVAVGAPYVSYWHPWNAVGFDLVLRRADLSVRWFNPAGAWIWPAGPGPSAFYFPVAPLAPQSFDAELQGLFAADAVQPVHAIGYAVYHVSQPLALERRLESLLHTRLAWPPELSRLPPPRLPLPFGDRFALLGAELQEARTSPGQTLRLLTYWEVLRADPAPVVAFVHLTSDGRDIWGQYDGLDVRPVGLLPGDRFVQVHLVPVKPETPPGAYSLQVGLYGPDTLIRLPITVMSGSAADRVWVAEVEVR
jgi:hypothetical protein